MRRLNQLRTFVAHFIVSLCNARRVLLTYAPKDEVVKLSPPPGVPIANIPLEVFLDLSSSEQKLFKATTEVSGLKLNPIPKEDRVAGQNYVHVLQSTSRLRLICAHGSGLVSNSDTVGITPTHAISVDESDDNASEPPWPAKDGYQIFQLISDANDDVRSLRSQCWY